MPLRVTPRTLRQLRSPSITEEQLATLLRGRPKEAAPRRNKFNARACVVDGQRFDSQKEGRRYLWLKSEERAGRIRDLVCQPVFPIVVGGARVCKYVGDFSYRQQNNDALVVEDVKSSATRTSVYRLKVKLVWACHKIAIKEID